MLREAKQLISAVPKLFETPVLVRESLKQHKYSRIAYASYLFSKPDETRALFNEMPELRNFEMDKMMSTPECSVFVNNQTRECVVTFRGTSNLKDVKDDLFIVISKEAMTMRFQQSLEIMKRVIQRYRGFKIVTASHSLGGGIGLFISKKLGIESHNFNPAESIVGALHNDNTNVFNYRTHTDLASIANKIEKNKAYVSVQTRLGVATNIESVHRLNNFFDKRAKRVVSSNGDTHFESNKSSTIHERTAYLGFFVDLLFVARDIRLGINNHERTLKTLDNIVNDVSAPSVARLAMDSPDGVDVMRFFEDFTEREIQHHDEGTFAELLQNAKDSLPQGVADGSGYKPQYIDSFQKDVAYKQVMGDPTPESEKIEQMLDDFQVLKEYSVNRKR
jgi:hypothetical protein